MGRKRAERNYRISVVNAGGVLKKEDARLFAKWFLRWAIANGSIQLPQRKGAEA